MSDQQPAGTTPGDQRLALARKFETVSSTSGVGLSLGVWAGRGDWAATSAAHRDREGRRALAELDQLIANLTEFRRQLAAVVEPDEPDGPQEVSHDLT
jgi:hypothetical protein